MGRQVAVTMPRLSDSMTEGTVVRWLKRDGEQVRRGEAIVDIETDKATMAFEAEAAGVLHLETAEGQTVAVGAPIATITTTDEAGAQAPPPQPSRPTAAMPASDATRATTAPPGAAAPPVPARGALNVSPLARRLAVELGVELEAIAGSGPYARILKRDVAAAPRGVNGRRAAPRPLPAAGVGESVSLATIFVETEVSFGRALELREQLRTSLTPAPTLDDIVVKAVATALREHPRLNSSWRDGELVVHDRIDIATAIVVADELFMPTIAGADALSLAAIAQRAAELARLAADGKLHVADLEPGTFSVTNLGGFGATRFTPVLAASQAASLGVGALRSIGERDGTSALVASVTLVCDARVAHPAHAAMFLESLAELIEAPMRLLL